MKKNRGPRQFLSGELRTVQFKMVLTPEEYKKLSTLCEKLRVQASSFFRSALADACQKENIS